MAYYLRDKKKLKEATDLIAYLNEHAGRKAMESYCSSHSGLLINDTFLKDHELPDDETRLYIFETEYDKRICYDGWCGVVFDRYNGFTCIEDVAKEISSEPGRFVIVDDDETREVPWSQFESYIRSSSVVPTASSIPYFARTAMA